MESTTTRIHLKRSTVTTLLVGFGTLSGLIGLLAGRYPLTVLGLAALGAVAVDVAAAVATLAGVRLELHGPPDAVAGLPSEWVITARGVRRPVVVSPAVVPRSPRYLLEAGGAAVIALPPFSRGLIHHVVLDLTATGPLGLYQAGRRILIPLSVPLAVGPSPVPLEMAWPRPRAMAFGLTDGAPVGDDLFRGLRPYQRGDERRRIHWGATARHRQLMVRELDGTGVVGLRVLVEPGEPGPMADHVTGVAATVTADALSRGWAVQLVTADGAADRPQTPSPTPPFKSAWPTPIWHPAAATTRVAMIGGLRMAHHQLATATQGPLVAPPWGGLTCRVTPRGVLWE